MENKLEFTDSVYTPELKETQKKEQSAEYSLPDYIPDIRRVLSCEVKTEKDVEYTDDKKLRYEGDMIFGVMLLGEDDSLNYVNIASRYRGEFDVGETDGAYITYKTDERSARALDPRTLQCRGTLIASLNRQKYTSTRLEPDENAEGLRLEVLRGELESLFADRASVCGVECEHEIALGTEYPEIARIVCCKVTPCRIEHRVVDDAVSVNMTLGIHILYADSAGGYHGVYGEAEIAEDVACKNIGGDPGVCISVTVGEISAGSETNDYGEDKLIEVSASCCIEVAWVNRMYASAVKDVYSPDALTEPRSEIIRASVCSGNVNGNFTFTKQISCEDAGIASDADIICAFADVSPLAFAVAEGGRVVGNGELTFDLLGSTDGHITGGRVTCDVRYASPLAAEDEDISVEARAYVESFKVKKDAGRIMLEAEIAVSGYATAKREYDLVTSVRASGERERDDSYLTLVFPDGGSLWDIAKGSGVGAAEILEANDCTEEELTQRKVIVIPSISEPRK